MAVVTGASGADPEAASQSATQFAALIDTTIALNQQIAQMLNLDSADNDAQWHAASAASEIVAAHYRATSHAPTHDEAAAIVTTLREATTALDGLGVGGTPNRTRKSQNWGTA